MELLCAAKSKECFMRYSKENEDSKGDRQKERMVEYEPKMAYEKTRIPVYITRKT
jgi:hypothetical protein